MLCCVWRPPLILCDDSDPAHVTSRGAGGGHVANIVPLCRLHHSEQHDIGIPAFEALHGVSLRAIAEEIAREIRRRRKP